MREIKVRFWDEVNNKFWHGGEEGEGIGEECFQTFFIENTLVGMMGESVNVGFGECEIIERKLPVSQYTGLKDKNSAEIFDKDIVEIKGHAFEGPMKIDGNFEVGYNERMELCCGNLLLHRQLAYVTVIGNVFEHPHLLEVNQ